MQAKLTPINFSFHPYQFDKKNHVLEKSEENGAKRRYLKGIASGMSVDAHGERLTQNCVKSLQDQASSGDLLLYSDKHGIKFTDDIGRVEKSEITPTGDWIIEARLYNQADGIGANTLEKIDKLWKQLNGIPPYTTPKQKGFSIEGYIPDDGIVEMSSDGRRVIDAIDLDGVVVVPRPAYKTSIANSIYKALNENPPWIIEKSINNFKSIIATEEVQSSFYKQRYIYNDKLEEEIENIMLNDTIRDKSDALKTLFNEYSSAMIELIVQSKDNFVRSKVPDRLNSIEFNYLGKQEIKSINNNNKFIVLKNLFSNLELLEKKLLKEVR